MTKKNTPIVPETDPVRQAALELLYIQHFGTLLDIAGESNSKAITPITPMTPFALVSGLERFLPDYTGDLTETAFCEWAEAITAQAREFYTNLDTYQLFIYDGIWRMLRGYTDLIERQNVAVLSIKQPLSTVEEISQQTWEWVFENLYSLLAPSQPAQIGTRIDAEAYWKARTWITYRLRARRRFCNLADHEKGVKPKGRQTIFPEDDGAALSKAIAAADAPEPKKRKRSKMSDPGPNWGEPTKGALLLCHVCGQIKAVSEVNGYTAILHCGHSRTSASDNTFGFQAPPALLRAA